jgi:hypothetical protein
MFSSEQYRAKAAEYLKLAANTDSPNEVREFGDLERSYTVLANNEEWLERKELREGAAFLSVFTDTLQLFCR